MTTNTPRVALPYPDPGDNFAEQDLQVKALALALDDNLPSTRVRQGRFTGATNASGQVTIPHGLGVTPTSVQVTPVGSASQVACLQSAPTSTNINATIRNVASAGAVVASTVVNVDWIACA